MGHILISRTAQPVATIQIVYFDTQIVKAYRTAVASSKDRSMEEFLVLFVSGRLSIPYDVKSVFKA